MGDHLARVDEEPVEAGEQKLEHDIERPHRQLGKHACRPAVQAVQRRDRAEPHARYQLEPPPPEPSEDELELELESLLDQEELEDDEDQSVVELEVLSTSWAMRYISEAERPQSGHVK